MDDETKKYGPPLEAAFGYMLFELAAYYRSVCTSPASSDRTRYVTREHMKETLRLATLVVATLHPDDGTGGMPEPHEQLKRLQAVADEWEKYAPDALAQDMDMLRREGLRDSFGEENPTVEWLREQVTELVAEWRRRVGITK